MYGETYLEKKRSFDRSEADVRIESVDTTVSYLCNRQSMKLAISVIDHRRRPVRNGEVVLEIKAPDGSQISLSQKTDSHGIALFEMNDIDRGRWKAGISGVRHPEYEVSLNHHDQLWLVNDV